MIVHVVDHRRMPCRLLPLNVAPTAGPVDPAVHSTLVVSGLLSPMRVTSDTGAHTASAGASMSTETVVMSATAAAAATDPAGLGQAGCTRHRRGSRVGVRRPLL